EQDLLESYRLLTPEQAVATVSLVRWGAGLDRSEPPAPPPRPARPARNSADTERLRAAAEELAAAYRAPLPDGDAGLVAAVERWRELHPLHSFERRGYKYTFEDEEEIITPISDQAEFDFETKIKE